MIKKCGQVLMFTPLAWMVVVMMSLMFHGYSYMFTQYNPLGYIQFLIWLAQMELTYVSLIVAFIGWMICKDKKEVV